MIRRHAGLLRLLLVAADAALGLLVILGTASVRFGNLEVVSSHAYYAIPNPPMAITGFLAAWIGMLYMQGLYRGRARWTVRGDVAAVLRATLFQLALTLSMLYILKLGDVSRLLIVVLFPVLALSAIAIRLAVRQVLVFARDRGRNVRFMLVVGANARASAFADLVEGHAELGLIVIGHLKAGAADNGVALRRPLLGSIDSLEQILHSQIVDEVAICLPYSMEGLIEQCALLCAQEGKAVRIPVAPLERVLTSGRLESVDGVGVYSLVNGPDRTVGLIVKRVIDIVGSAVAVSLMSPVMLLIAVSIKLDSRGPVFFRQERVGLHGRSIRLLKFRSMCQDAEEQLDELRHKNEVKGHAFKLTNDPRVTRVSRFLRRSSLDELPQLWNVLRGQMSLVGPRPPLPSEVAGYDVWHRRRLSMKPGMTGLWQVGSRRSVEFDRWVEQDLEYIDGWSLWLDFKIIARTVPAVLAGTGR